MKKGLPNSLPLPNSLQKPWQVFWQCQFSFALFFGKHIQVAHISTGVEFAWLSTQDGAGGFEFAGNAFPIDPVPDNVAYLKDVECSELCLFQRDCVDSCFLNQAIERKAKLTIAAFMIDIYIQQEASLCCQSVASQDGTRHRNRIVFS